MSDLEENLTNWEKSLFSRIDVGGLLSRNPTAYKWKALWRVWMVREAAFWREHDLMAQSYALHCQGHSLGARILLRSGFETLAALIYLNLLMQKVLDGKLPFADFGDKTTQLLIGARNNEEMPKSINIITVLEKCDAKYPGLLKLYADLSETAHPSYEGMMRGYSETNHAEYETNFRNRWKELYGDQHPDSMMLCMGTFHHEYEKVWPDLIERLEIWVEENDAELEAAKTT